MAIPSANNSVFSKSPANADWCVKGIYSLGLEYGVLLDSVKQDWIDHVS